MSALAGESPLTRPRSPQQRRLSPPVADATLQHQHTEQQTTREQHRSAPPAPSSLLQNSLLPVSTPSTNISTPPHPLHHYRPSHLSQTLHHSASTSAPPPTQSNARVPTDSALPSSIQSQPTAAHTSTGAHPLHQPIPSDNAPFTPASATVHPPPPVPSIAPPSTNSTSLNYSSLYPSQNPQASTASNANQPSTLPEHSYPSSVANPSQPAKDEEQLAKHAKHEAAECLPLPHTKSAAVILRGESISLARRAAATAKRRREEARAVLEQQGGEGVDSAYTELVESSPSTRANVSQNKVKRNKRVKWSDGEVNALRAGVTRYGAGRWAVILREFASDFHPVRISVDLKDKWRNLYKAQRANGTSQPGEDPISSAQSGGASSDAQNANTSNSNSLPLNEDVKMMDVDQQSAAQYLSQDTPTQQITDVHAMDVAATSQGGATVGHVQAKTDIPDARTQGMAAGSLTEAHPVGREPLVTPSLSGAAESNVAPMGEYVPEPISRGQQHALPSDQQHALPDDQQHALPDDQQHALPNDQQHALPNDQQHALPNDQQHASLQEDQHHSTLPDNQHHVPLTEVQHHDSLQHGQHHVPNSEGQLHAHLSDGQHKSSIPVGEPQVSHDKHVIYQQQLQTEHIQHIRSTPAHPSTEQHHVAPDHSVPEHPIQEHPAPESEPTVYADERQLVHFHANPQAHMPTSDEVESKTLQIHGELGPHVSNGTETIPIAAQILTVHNDAAHEHTSQHVVQEMHEHSAEQADQQAVAHVENQVAEQVEGHIASEVEQHVAGQTEHHVAGQVEHVINHVEHHVASHGEQHVTGHGEQHVAGHAEPNVAGHTEHHVATHAEHHVDKHSEHHLSNHANQHLAGHAEHHATSQAEQHLASHSEQHVHDHTGDLVTISVEQHIPPHSKQHIATHGEQHVSAEPDQHFSNATVQQASEHTSEHVTNHVAENVAVLSADQIAEHATSQGMVNTHMDDQATTHEQRAHEAANEHAAYSEAQHHGHDEVMHNQLTYEHDGQHLQHDQAGVINAGHHVPVEHVHDQNIIQHVAHIPHEMAVSSEHDHRQTVDEKPLGRDTNHDQFEHPDNQDSRMHGVTGDEHDSHVPNSRDEYPHHPHSSHDQFEQNAQETAANHELNQQDHLRHDQNQDVQVHEDLGHSHHVEDITRKDDEVAHIHLQANTVQSQLHHHVDISNNDQVAVDSLQPSMNHIAQTQPVSSGNRADTLDQGHIRPSTISGNLVHSSMQTAQFVEVHVGQTQPSRNNAQQAVQYEHATVEVAQGSEYNLHSDNLQSAAYSSTLQDRSQVVEVNEGHQGIPNVDGRSEYEQERAGPATLNPHVLVGQDAVPPNEGFEQSEYQHPAPGVIGNESVNHSQGEQRQDLMEGLEMTSGKSIEHVEINVDGEVPYSETPSEVAQGYRGDDTYVSTEHQEQHLQHSEKLDAIPGESLRGHDVLPDGTSVVKEDGGSAVGFTGVMADGSVVSSEAGHHASSLPQTFIDNRVPNENEGIGENKLSHTYSHVPDHTEHSHVQADLNGSLQNGDGPSETGHNVHDSGEAVQDKHIHNNASDLAESVNAKASIFEGEACERVAVDIVGSHQEVEKQIDNGMSGGNSQNGATSHDGSGREIQGSNNQGNERIYSESFQNGNRTSRHEIVDNVAGGYVTTDENGSNLVSRESCEGGFVTLHVQGSACLTSHEIAGSSDMDRRGNTAEIVSANVGYVGEGAESSVGYQSMHDVNTEQQSSLSGGGFDSEHRANLNSEANVQTTNAHTSEYENNDAKSHVGPSEQTRLEVGMQVRNADVDCEHTEQASNAEVTRLPENKECAAAITGNGGERETRAEHSMPRERIDDSSKGVNVSKYADRMDVDYDAGNREDTKESCAASGAPIAHEAADSGRDGGG